MNLIATLPARKIPFALLAGLVVAAITAQAAPPTLSVNDQRLAMANGFVYLEFDRVHPAIDVLKADFSGQGHYGANLAGTNSAGAAGLVLETVDADGSEHGTPDTGTPVRYQVLQNNASAVRVRLRGLPDRTGTPAATSDWTISLPADSRKFTLTIRTVLTGSRPVKAVALGLQGRQWFMSGFFQRGVMQYVRNGDQLFCTTNALHLFYTMDNQYGSLAVMPSGGSALAGWAMRTEAATRSVGLEAILAGNYPVAETWTNADWPSAPDVAAPAGKVWQTRLDIYPNNYAFPVATVPAQDPMAFADRRTLETAIYGSAAGVLGSFEHDGSAYPTLAFPKRPYGPMYTFFDPDAWSTVATLSYSGDPYLQDQARRIVELAGGNLRDGQIPHHFIDGQPTFRAISTAIQTGPNMFWTLAAIDYAAGSGDEVWLKQRYPQMKAATDWILHSYDPNRKMVNVGGPLFIDVFIRQGYTLDSNALLLRLLPLMSSVARFCDDPASAARYEGLTAAIKQGLNASLWDDHDHYVTQLNPDGTTRDLVDYDGNYAAIAFGATTDPQKISALYGRLDGGAHTHPGDRGTWTSEKYYGPADCYNGNTGDSATAMARIWWLDLASRYVTGDLANFNRYFQPVQADVFQHTWLTERYNDQGRLIRAPYYHEYPEITAMVLREMICGIDVKIDRVRIKPFGRANYHYQMGGLEVAYSPERIRLHVPGHGKRTYEVDGLPPQTVYAISTGQKVTTDADGGLTFQAPVGRTITVRQR